MRRLVVAWFDWWSLVAVALLFFMGLVAIGSGELAQGVGTFPLLKKQLIAAFLGMCSGGFLLTRPAVAFTQYAPLAWISALVMLVAVLFLGRELNGATGWFVIGQFVFQPIEWAKIAFVLMASRVIASDDGVPLRAKTVIKVGLMAIVVMALLMRQPDLGGAMVFVGVTGMMLWFGGISGKWIAGMLGMGVLFFALGWTLMFSQYQKDRISTFLHPEEDILGKGYNVHQAVVAIGSGGWLGRGFAGGSQSQLQFLPESQTDFIFAVIAEEFGLLGAGSVLLLCAVFVGRVVHTSNRSPDPFAKMFLFGGAMLFVIPISMHVGTNMGLLPATGIAFPLMSYGGSSLLMTGILLGMLFRTLWEVRAKEI